MDKKKKEGKKPVVTAYKRKLRPKFKTVPMTKADGEAISLSSHEESTPEKAKPSKKLKSMEVGSSHSTDATDTEDPIWEQAVNAKPVSTFDGSTWKIFAGAAEAVDVGEKQEKDEGEEAVDEEGMVLEQDTERQEEEGDATQKPKGDMPDLNKQYVESPGAAAAAHQDENPESAIPDETEQPRTGPFIVDDISVPKNVVHSSSSTKESSSSSSEGTNSKESSESSKEREQSPKPQVSSDPSFEPEESPVAKTIKMKKIVTRSKKAVIQGKEAAKKQVVGETSRGKKVWVPKTVNEDLDIVEREGKVISEKGFLAHVVRNKAYLRDIIDAMKWRKLCEIPKAHNLSWVSEFYAKLNESAGKKVKVRGKNVKFDATTINKFWELSPPAKCEYARSVMIREEAFYEQVLDVCAQPDRTWKNKARALKAKDLHADAYVWNHFLKHSLMPTSHDGEVQYERLVLLYCILDCRPIDVGQIVHREIRSNASKKPGPRFFPYLITELCKLAGVPSVETDVWQKGAVAINGLAIDRLRRNISDVRRGSLGVRAAVAAPASTDVMMRLEDEVKELRKNQEMMSLKMDALLMGLTDQRTVWKHRMDAEQVEAAVYAALAPDTGLAFPSFPSRVLMKTTAEEALETTSDYFPTH